MENATIRLLRIRIIGGKAETVVRQIYTTVPHVVEA
jgi:hypothetical protein